MYTIKTKISVKEKELIFIPGNTLFSVDTENKSLKEIDISQQIEQINKVKTMLGELKTESINKSEDIAGYKTKGIKVYNVNNDAVKFSMNTVFAKIPGIEKTVYPEFMKLEQSKQLVNLDIKQNEIIASMCSEIYIQGNLAKTINGNN